MIFQFATRDDRGEGLAFMMAASNFEFKYRFWIFGALFCQLLIGLFAR